MVFKEKPVHPGVKIFCSSCFQGSIEEAMAFREKPHSILLADASKPSG